MLIVNKTNFVFKVICLKGLVPLENGQVKPGKHEEFLEEVKMLPEKVVFREVRKDRSDFLICKGIPATLESGGYSVTIKHITD